MINQRDIFEIHRLANEGLSARKIGKALHLSRKTVGYYLANPTVVNQTCNTKRQQVRCL